MQRKSIFSSKSVIDFLYMFFSNIIKKAFGFVREIILAFFFGSSIAYANYLLLKTVADFFSQLTLGNALQANLMPKFTQFYAKYDSIDLSEVLTFSKSVMWKLFLVSQIVQLPIIWLLDPELKVVFIIISLLLGLVMSMNFFNSIFLTILQAKGEFKKHSIATTLNLFVSTFVLYPFALFFDIIGVVISRMIGAGTLFLKYIRPLLLDKGKEKMALKASDFNLSVMLLGNFANIIILLGRFVSGVDGGNNIAFFSYSVVLLNAFFTAVILNVNTLVLKFISVKKNFKIILFSTVVSLVISSLLVLIVQFFSVEIISLFFERGAFTAKDTIETASYLRSISWSFIFIFVSSSLFQPYFALPQTFLKKNSKYLASSFVFTAISVSAFLYFNNFGVRENSLYMIYSLTTVSFVLSIVASLKYYSYED
jgi:putative peptidoglycan lipid II flippase